MTVEARTFTDEERNEAYDWLQVGIEKGWVSDGFCFTHDGDQYMTVEEELEWEEGNDICCPVVKILV